jgi:MFS family permease
MHAEHGEFRRGWGTVLASVSGLAFGVAALAISYTIGVFLGPLNEEFGWSKQQILFAGTIVSVAVVGLSPVVGWITDRYGVRRMIIGSQLGFGLGFAGLATFTANLWTFYACYFLMALMASGTIAVTFSKLLTTEFIKHRGLALGLAMSGTGLCGFIVPPFVAYVVETFGWRAGYFALGLLPVCLALPLTLKFLHDAPRTSTTVTDAAHAADILGEVKAGQAFRSYRFWAMGITFLLASCTMTALITNFVPILGDQGYPPTEAAAIAGTFGLAVITGRVIVGLLIDRIWAPLVGFALFTPAAAAIVLLGLGALDTTGLIIAIATAGFAAGAEVDLMGYLVARYFGLKHFGKIYAGLYVMFALGPGITTPLFGGARDTFGSYELALYVAAAGLAFAGVLLITLGPYPRTSAAGMSR